MANNKTNYFRFTFKLKESLITAFVYTKLINLFKIYIEGIYIYIFERRLKLRDKHILWACNQLLSSIIFFHKNLLLFIVVGIRNTVIKWWSGSIILLYLFYNNFIFIIENLIYCNRRHIHKFCCCHIILL